MDFITINQRKIGAGYPVYMIAEMSANHGGSLERAKEIIYAAKESGADCIKLQTYTADTMTIPCSNSYFTLKSGLWKNENLYELYRRAATPWEWHEELFQCAKEAGIDMISTPFDKTAVDFLCRLDIPAFKTASFELIDLPLLSYAASKGKPMIVSTGMAELAEIEEAAGCIRQAGNESFALLKCISSYPAAADEMNLRMISDISRRFCVPAGLSDHSCGNLAAVIAVSLNASVIEKHFCLSRDIQTADSAFSMEPSEFKQLVQAVRETEKALGAAEYGPLEQEKENLKNRKSIFAVKDIKKGEIFTEENIRVIRPGYGLKPKYYEALLGTQAARDVDFGMPLRKEDVLLYG